MTDEEKGPAKSKRTKFTTALGVPTRGGAQNILLQNLAEQGTGIFAYEISYGTKFWFAWYISNGWSTPSITENATDNIELTSSSRWVLVVIVTDGQFSYCLTPADQGEDEVTEQPTYDWVSVTTEVPKLDATDVSGETPTHFGLHIETPSERADVYALRPTFTVVEQILERKP